MSKRPETARRHRRCRTLLLAAVMLLPSPALTTGVADPNYAPPIRGSAATRVLMVGFHGLPPAAHAGYRIRAGTVNGAVLTGGGFRLHAGAVAARVARGDRLQQDGFEAPSAPR